MFFLDIMVWKSEERTGTVSVITYMHVKIYLILSQKKLISAQVCAEDMQLTLVMKWTPASSISPLNSVASCLLTTKHVRIKQNQRDGVKCLHRPGWTLHTDASLVSLPSPCSFTRSAAADSVKPGDQAPATASAEAAKRGEEEQAADQHCCNSGSRGNESKGTAHTALLQTIPRLFSCRAWSLPCSGAAALQNNKSKSMRETI